jgi:hypothetical protein
MLSIEAIRQLCVALQETRLAVFISESAIVFPWIEAVHVLAITFVVGSIAVVDLRILGLASRSDSIRRMTAEIVPWTIAAFVLAAVTGLLLFISSAERYFDNWYFRMKLLLLLCAGLNMLQFHFVTGKQMAEWDRGVAVPVAAKLSGGLSLLFWVVIVFFGRWIGFTL